MVEKGFVHISLSDFIRREAEKRKLPLTRQILQDIGCQMRQNYGVGVFSKMALAKIGKTGNAVITSIRNPGEIEILAQTKKFVLVNVTASRKIRFARILARTAKDEQKITFADFCESEAREIESSDAAAQQLERCAAMADFSVVNDKDLASFHRAIDCWLERAGLLRLNLPQNYDRLD